MGFMNSLLDVIKRERPDHLAVCFDKGGSVDRVEMYEEYKEAVSLIYIEPVFVNFSWRSWNLKFSWLEGFKEIKKNIKINGII